MSSRVPMVEYWFQLIPIEWCNIVKSSLFLDTSYYDIIHYIATRDYTYKNEFLIGHLDFVIF